MRTDEIKSLPLPLGMKKFWTWDMIEPIFKIIILIAGIGIIIISIENNIIFHGHFLSMVGLEGYFVRGLFLVSMIIFLGSLVIRTYLWFKYQPFDSGEIKKWPQVTVLVPAYNEGETIYRTIQSIVNSDYQKGKLNIIAINDGSTDNTYFYMEKARREFSDCVTVMNFSENRGKRRAIYEAFKVVKSPIMVSIDSDTRLDRNSLKEVVTPLILDQSIGAVTGRIKVWNNRANMLTKMLNAHFAMAFDFTRAIQSTFYSVFCLSGAFTAYRVSLLAPIMDNWLCQKFLNKTCTYGEDRSLTNHLLREGHGSFFQRTAVSYTMVPEKLSMVLKMFTRWARSNIRESIIFSRFMFNPKRKGRVLLSFIEFFTIVSLMILHFIWFYYFLFSGLINTHYIIRILSYSVLFGFFYMLYFLRIEGRKDSPYVIVFSLFSSFFMIWIFTFAAFTLTRSSWSTR